MPWRYVEVAADRFHGRISERPFGAQAQGEMDADKLPIAADEAVADKAAHPGITPTKPPPRLQFLQFFHLIEQLSV